MFTSLFVSHRLIARRPASLVSHNDLLCFAGLAEDEWARKVEIRMGETIIGGSLPQVLFLSRQKICLSRQTCVCRDKTRLLSQYLCRGAAISVIFLFLSRRSRLFAASRQNYVCRDKSFVAAKILLSRKTRVCREKHVFVGTKRLSRQKMVLVAVPANDTTKVCLSRQNFCRDK